MILEYLYWTVMMQIAQMINNGVIDIDDERGIVKLTQDRFKKTEGHARTWFFRKKRNMMMQYSIDDREDSEECEIWVALQLTDEAARAHLPFQGMKPLMKKREDYKTKQLRELLKVAA